MEKLIYFSSVPLAFDDLGAVPRLRSVCGYSLEGAGEFRSCVTAWVDCLERRARLERWLETRAPASTYGYLVTAATLARPSAAGAPARAGQLWVVHRDRGESRRDFYARWHDQLRLGLPSDAWVVRNRVVRPLDPRHPVIEGVVEVRGASLRSPTGGLYESVVQCSGEKPG